MHSLIKLNRLKFCIKLKKFYTNIYNFYFVIINSNTILFFYHVLILLIFNIFYISIFLKVIVFFNKKINFNIFIVF